MSKLIKTVAVLGFTVTLAACGGNADDEVVIVDPIVVDPVSPKF
ncbi:hypothetical protein [Jannaschia aquimarina]|uniref:Lipoprotein n=1 Tax=Jannaschia aquimarina TaxID=935700 RepID=A0A0D1EJU7_9RHOB|nr:hypothetical protein [Jannaschia aquimarina]KIT16080.1 hypothetical protein jaqu_23520 [Jannaschia aquimarina]SNT01879.1 hypothetical protein SAMN05421775_104263 [Jannaschia aquimarina]